MWALAIPWLKNNWLAVVAAICWIASLAITFHYGYGVGESGKLEVIAEFNAYKEKQELLLATTQRTAIANALAANTKLRQSEYEREEHVRKYAKELAVLREELDRVKLDAALVRLFDDSVRASRKAEPPAKSEQSGNAVPNAEANRPQDTGGNQGQGVQQFSLYDLAENILENNKNHDACVDQVMAWQDFYKKLYEQFQPLK